MKNKLKVQQFIEQHSDWEQLLAEKPYCIQISHDKVFDRNLVLLKYNQIESDFHNEIVRECRGLILDADTYEAVSVPFFKFGNYGESYCPDIDWSSCWVGEKLDGSLIKIVRLGNNLLVSTNGTIDAYKAPIAEQIGCKAKTFGELVDESIDNAYRANFPERSFLNPIDVYNWFFYLLEEGKTYMFELTSPFNKVVVTWHETRLNFLGVRDNQTFEETYFSEHVLKDHFNTPKVFPLTSVDECIVAAEKLDCNAEGYVVCDKFFNRVKIKSPLYCSLHHMKGNGILSYERGLDIIKSNEIDEVIIYFPEFKDHLEQIKFAYDKLIFSLETAWERFMQLITPVANRKEAAIWIQKNFEIPSVGFSLLDGKVNSVKDWIKKCPSKNLIKYLDFKLDSK